MNPGNPSKPTLKRMNDPNAFLPLDRGITPNANYKRRGSIFLTPNEIPLKRVHVSIAGTSQAPQFDINLLRVENGKLRIDLNALKGNYDLLSNTVNQKVNKIDDLTNQLSRAQAEKDQLKDELKKELAKTVGPSTSDPKHKQEISKLKNELDKANANLKRDEGYYLRKLDRKNDTVNKLELKLKEKTDKIASFESKQEATKKMIDELNQKLNSERQTGAEIRSMYDKQVVESKSTIASLNDVVKNKVAPFQVAAQQHSLKNSELEIALSNAKKSLDALNELENEKSSLNEKIRELRSDLKQLEKDKNKELHSLRELNQKLVEDKKSVKSELDNSLKENDGLKSEISNLTKKQEQLDSSKLELTNEKNSLLSQIKIKDDEIETLRSTAPTSSDELAKVLAEKQKVEKKLARRNQRLQVMIGKNQKLEDDLRKQSKMLRDMDEMSRISNEATAKENGYKSQIANLDSQLEFAKNERSRIENEYNVVVQRLDNKRKDVEKVTLEKEDYEKKFNESKKQTASLNQQLKDLEKARDDLLLEKKRAEEASSLEENSTRLEKQLQEKLAEKSRNQQRLEQAVTKLEAENRQLKFQAQQQGFYTGYSGYPIQQPSYPDYHAGFNQNRGQGGYRR